MKKIICSILVAVLANQSWAAIAFVQSKSCNANTFTGGCAYNTNVTAGNLLIINCVAAMTTDTFTGTSSAGDTVYTVGTSIRNQAGAGLVRTQVFYVKNAIGGATTFTCADSGATATFIQQSIHEYSGASKTSPFDSMVSSAPAAALSNPTTSGPVTTTVANEMIFSAAMQMAGATTNNNGTLREAYVNNSFVSTQDVVLTSATTYTPNFVQGGTFQWVMYGVAIKPQGGTVTFK